MKLRKAQRAKNYAGFALSQRKFIKEGDMHIDARASKGGKTLTLNTSIRALLHSVTTNKTRFIGRFNVHFVQ